MDKNCFFILKLYVFLFVPGRALAMCDITDILAKPVSNQALEVWALLDLAQQEQVTDQELFYHELCQSTLKLCKEVQQLKDSGYALADRQIDCFGQLFNYLHTNFKALPKSMENDQRYSNAIDIILQYADYFLKQDSGIQAD